MFIVPLPPAAQAPLRGRRAGPRRDEPRARLDGFPVVVLFLIATFIFIKLPGIVDVPAAGANGQLEIKVTGRQFYWQFEYPNGVVAIDTMRAPAGVPVELEVTSPANDVIHSWWIPALGGKIDAIPGPDEPHLVPGRRRRGRTRGSAPSCAGSSTRTCSRRCRSCARARSISWLAAENAAQTAGTSTELGKQEWSGVCAKCHGLAGRGRDRGGASPARRS